MTPIKLTNYTDHSNHLDGLLDREGVRSVQIEALVDTGATELAIPADVARALGLRVEDVRRAKLADGSVVALEVVSGVRIEILGRRMTCDAIVLPEGTTALIGQIPLEGLDLIVDPGTREVRVNPRSPDAPMVELLRAERLRASVAFRQSQ